MVAGYDDVVLVGEGGLGRVYRARRVSTGGTVAIKELRDVAEASPAWHRAMREVEAMLRLKGHPNVVSVEEVVRGPSGPCIVMEFLSGGSLHDRLQRGHLSVAEVVLVGQHVASALVAAHAGGVVHRDVKPHNLLVSSFGHVKVADFGIAALMRAAGSQTQTQSLTLAYASPEELDGAFDVGPQTDVYSLAATLAHLATGQKPSFRDRSLPLLPFDAEPALVHVGHALRQSLAIEPMQRPTMADLVAMFDDAQTRLAGRRIGSLGQGAALVISTPSLLPGAAAANDATVLRATMAATVVSPQAITPTPPPPPPPPAPLPAHAVRIVGAAGRAVWSDTRRLVVASAAVVLMAIVATLVVLAGSRSPAEEGDAADQFGASVLSTPEDAATPSAVTVASSVEAFAPTDPPAAVAPTLSPVPVVAVQVTSLPSTSGRIVGVLAELVGVTVSGQACRDSVAVGGLCPSSRQGSWNFLLTFTDGATDGASAAGVIEWPGLGSTHAVEAQGSGSTIHFVETDALVEGQALTGCVYDIEWGAQAPSTGRWSCPDGSAGPFQLG